MEPSARDTGETAVASATRSRLKWLMAVRLGLSLGVFALALVFLGVGRDGAASVERGLYGTVAAAFGATLLYASLFPFVRRLTAFALLQLATDVAVVTSLVCWSGGADSFFGELLRHRLDSASPGTVARGSEQRSISPAPGYSYLRSG